MATALSITSPSLLDLAKMYAPDGSVLPYVEALEQKNGFIRSMVWKEGNLDVGHRISAQNALPSISWVRVNEGVTASKGNSDTYDETCGILEGLSSVEVKLAELHGNPAEFRARQDQGFVTAMGNTLESAFFYESSATNPERIMGLTSRLNSTSSAYGNQILSADPDGGNADNCSIWMVVWGDDTVYGITPRGKGAALAAKDMGIQRSESSGVVKFNYETSFKWHVGFCVQDYRAVVRIANIDTDRLTVDAATGTDLIRTMIKGYYQLFAPERGRLAVYCNRTIGSFLHNQALSKTASASLTLDPTPQSPGVFGKPIMRFMGGQIHITDALITTEAQVS